MRIESMLEADWAEVARIYQEGLDTGIASFETLVPGWDAWDRKHLPHSRLVAKVDESILGWAALAPVSKREVYRGVAEVSIYIARASQGQGVGKALLERLIDESEEQGLWTLQSSIFPANDPSIRLHYALGFRLVGRREKVAQRNGQWFDNLLFERRSKKII